MTITEILNILPHRYPMLMVDRILEVEPGKRSRGLKNVSMNEPHFQGHYPGLPIMPGVLIIEALAQAGAVILLSEDKYLGMVPMIGSIDGVKFRRPVVPGDQLILESELLWIKSNVGRLRGRATVDGELAAEMEMTFKLARRE
jgi:beta-hydroxyacyl-ACP dehydratase FabZ